ncbi:hypothetical protein [Aerosakkonema funiforme]|nr:hypothetical protein [Aerosakkonema funiforme]
MTKTKPNIRRVTSWVKLALNPTYYLISCAVLETALLHYLKLPGS